MNSLSYPVVIIGGGLAGISAALALAPLPVLLVNRTRLGTEASSPWAQGGIAAAMGADDSPALHAADTMAAGDGLCDAATVARITEAGPALIQSLAEAGVRFDRTPAGALDLGLEAAHACRRIVHAGDGTGREVMHALEARLRATPSITLLEGHAAQHLLLRAGAIAGVVLNGPAGLQTIATRNVVLATGGIGGLFLHTTNPRGAWGQGLLLAARAGAVLTDLEFVQFHPTALHVGRDPMPLVSEAVRGEGAILIDEHGARFMAGQGRAELEPRDVVSRAVWAHLQEGHRVFLDARASLGAGFSSHFPAITAFCAEARIDPATQPIPIHPAAHYHMGGIATDAEGRTSVPGLFACGECAGTGLHGANRLASNSLLEAAICGAAVARAIKGGALPDAVPLAAAPLSRPVADPAAVRRIMTAALGVLRNTHGLTRAINELYQLVDENGPASDPAAVGLTIAVCALRRRESRGGHWRIDFPARDPTATNSRITLSETLQAAREIALVAA